VYAWPPEDVARIAERVGARVNKVRQLHDGEIAYEVSCPSHQSKVELLGALADYDSHSPDVRRMAERIAAGAPDSWYQVVALHAYVRDRVVFTRELRETFTSTMQTLKHGLGDCDCSALALCALLRSLGHDAGMMTLGQPPKHVAAGVRHGGRMHWLETTINAEPGEHPIAAGKRLGVKMRDDLQGVEDIPEPPAHYVYVTTAVLLLALAVTWYDIRTRGNGG
jgi:transglutaminase-like putative cysteine protease